MIASIEGTLTLREGNRLVISIGGVGIEVLVPLRTLESLGTVGARVRLETYLHVREDALTLYGFADENEKLLFQALLGVSGVGPKVALGILSVSDAGGIVRLIREEQTAALRSFPGVGRKTAERIVLELKDRIDFDRYLPGAPADVSAGFDRRLFEEAVSALVTLGLSKSIAEKAIAAIAPEDLGDAFGIEDLVRESLKTVSRGAK